MTTVVGFVSEKGGVGKTTACYHIAIGLHRYHEKSVMVVDTDYQRGGISCRLVPDLLDDFRSGRVRGRTLFDQFQFLYSGQVPDGQVDLLDTGEGIKLLPADPRLAQVTVEKMPSSNNIRENNRRLLAHLSLIKSTLAPQIATYDYVLIDSHPELSDLLRCVVFASNYCVSPVKLDVQSAIGVPSAQEAINGVNEDMKMIAATLVGEAKDYQPTQFAGSIGMMAREYDGGLKATERTQYSRLKRSGGIFENYVTEGDGLRQAAAARCPVYDVSGANAEKQAHHFREVTREFLARCP
ncbi:MAG: ParA family protein [Polyangiaceae bacterium]